MTSQTWLTPDDFVGTIGHKWWHYVVVVVPYEIDDQDKALMYVTCSMVAKVTPSSRKMTTRGGGARRFSQGGGLLLAIRRVQSMSGLHVLKRNIPMTSSRYITGGDNLDSPYRWKGNEDIEHVKLHTGLSS